MGIMEQTARFMRIGKQLEREPSENWEDLQHREFRRKILEEEYTEYLDDGEKAHDKVLTCDGLADIIVVAGGTLFSYVGYDCAMEILSEVGRSNLSKFVRNEDGDLEPIFREDGKILKGPDTFKPDIRGILERYGEL